MINIKSTYQKFKKHRLREAISRRKEERIYRSKRWKSVLPILRHVLPASLMCIPILTHAQMLNDLGMEDTQIDTANIQALRVDLDALAFFRDNEYQSKLQDGYSLPGVRLTPHLAYTPIKQINIEAGASMLFFNGANKYPCFVYHDIGTWKGNQYQPGAHVLPWARLQASFKHIDVVLGNIYGGSNHRLLRPLYNAEQNISADPEMGLQILADTKYFKLDAWLNWQSYQFEMDTHQEAFTVGVAGNIRYTPNHSLQVYSPIQLVVQHRGGEQDQTNLGVQTISNAALGIGVCQALKGWFNFYDVQLNAIGCYQQAGQLWPFNTGIMGHLGLRAQFQNHFNATFDYTYAPKGFVSLYGNPFYSTLPLKYGGSTVLEDGSIMGNYDFQFNKMNNFHLCLDYHYTFAKHYTLGADIEAFALHTQKISTEENTNQTLTNKANEFNFSFGVYMRVSPSILIKKFRQ